MQLVGAKTGYIHKQEIVMDPKLVALIALRTVGTLSGHGAIVAGIDKLRAAYEAGQNIDSHLADIADRLEAGDDLDTWDDITARIDAEVDDFLDEPPPAA